MWLIVIVPRITNFLKNYCLIYAPNVENLNVIDFFNACAPNFRFKLKKEERDFFVAVILDNLNSARRLVNENPELVQLSDVQGNTAQHYAAALGHAEIYDLLSSKAVFAYKQISVITRGYISTPMDGCFSNFSDETARDWIIRYNQLPKFKKFLVQGMQQSAACYGRIDLLFDKGSLSDSRAIARNNQETTTLLHIAAQYGQRELLARFINDEENPKVVLRKRNKKGTNVFHLAVQSGNEALVDDLLKIDPNLIQLKDE